MRFSLASLPSDAAERERFRVKLDELWMRPTGCALKTVARCDTTDTLARMKASAERIHGIVDAENRLHPV